MIEAGRWEMRAKVLAAAASMKDARKVPSSGPNQVLPQRADWKAGHKAVCRSDSLKQVNIDAKSLRVVRQHTESKNIARFVLDAIGARKALRGDSMHGMRVTVRSGADLLDGCSDVVG